MRAPREPERVRQRGRSGSLSRAALAASRAAGCLLLGLTLGLPAPAVFAQNRAPTAGFGFGRPPPPPPPSGRPGAQVDFTGYWTAVISEDWRWRMVTPLKGDFANIPLNVKGQTIGEQWDPARDEAAGEQCKAYAAPGVLRLPEHLHIYWQNDQTLIMQIDAGMQTRILNFDPSAPISAPPDWQGHSVARWEGPMLQPYAGAGLGLYPRGNTRSKALEVITTDIRPGYLRKNGIPFSASTKLTEYYDWYQDPNDSIWILVTSIVEDPVYLNAPWVTSTDFKRLQDGALWHPTPCSAR